MTMANISHQSTVPIGVRAVVEATQELREAKAYLRDGHLIKGVQRNERAKSALAQAIGALSTTQHLPSQDHAHYGAFLEAVQAYQVAYEQHRRQGAGSPAALALARATKQLLQELEQLERISN